MENSPRPLCTPDTAAPAWPAAVQAAVWRAHEIGRLPQSSWASGWPLLDAQLPGGGWPAQALTELLLPHPGIGELRLLGPVLAEVQRQQQVLMLFGTPAQLCPWSWQALGLALQPLVLVGSPAPITPTRQTTADLLWALEQALASGHAGAVLAWLPPRLPPDALRRLQLAAQNHPGPAFLLRDETYRTQPSPAPLRLALQPAAADALALQVFKRRGAPMAEPLVLTLPPVLSPTARARAERAAASLPTRVPATAPVAAATFSARRAPLAP